jgi:hypothetical protein
MAVKKQEKKVEEVEIVEVESKVEETGSNVYSNFSRWSKIYSILGFIGAGFLILVGIPYILALGFGLLMIAAGVFYIIAYNKVLQASNLVSALEKSSDKPKEFKANTEEVISNLKSYFKIISIINIVSIIGTIIMFILFIVIFAAIGASFSESFNESIKNDPNLLPQPVINYKD